MTVIRNGFRAAAGPRLRRSVARALCCLIAGCAAVARGETTVTGVENELLENVLAYLDIDNLDCDAGDIVVRRALDQAAMQSAEALNAYGYYASSVTTTLDLSGDCWEAGVAIEPGEPVRLREVDIRVAGPAAESALFRNILEANPLVEGAVLNHRDYETFKRQLVDLGRTRGYAEAAFTESQIDIYPEIFAADLRLRFESGPRYSIGTVTVLQEGLAPEFVDAFHDLDAGALYDNTLLTSAFLSLNDSGYFSDVDVRALPPDPVTRTIPVEIVLTPAARRIISYGFGYSTDTGPRFRFGRSIRRFNDRGHQLNLEAQISPVVSEFTSIYRMPTGDPRFDWLNFSLGAKREETDTSLARSIEAGVRRVVSRTRGWSRTQYLNYVVEDFEVASQKGRPHLLIPGVDWTRIRGDDALRPRNGSKFSFELSAADEDFLSDSNFVQTIVQAKWIKSVAPRGRVLLRGRAGYTVDDQFEQLPPSIRFFAGGDHSIRGFDFESLGPVDANGEVIGGSRLLEISAEYEHDIRARWSIAVFADGGNAFDESGLDMRTGAGIGARWRSPLGPVRIDVAWPVDDVEHGARLHIVLGPDL